MVLIVMLIFVYNLFRSFGFVNEIVLFDGPTNMKYFDNIINTICSFEPHKNDANPQFHRVLGLPKQRFNVFMTYSTGK